MSLISTSRLGAHSEAFACPTCHGPLDVVGAEIDCPQCRRSYLGADRHPDFAPASIAPHPSAKPRFAPLRLQDPLIASRYETCSRPAFFRIMGGNWQNQLTFADEVAYLQARFSTVDGPVLDLACGAGSWTKAIADVVGAGDVIGLDISRPLLERCRVAVPGIAAVRGSALALPFRDSSLAGVNCWNSLQQLPSPPNVIAEVGRCLRAGGLFTLLTYRPATDPLARYFQRRHEAAFGVTAFSEERIRSWLTAAHLRVVELDGPGSFLIVTAERTAT
jgi:SAM-dependent methyltransferase